MTEVKLKKDVEFSGLLKYGFKFDEKRNVYTRESFWVLENAGAQLTVEVESRKVYTHIFCTGSEKNEELKGQSTALHNVFLLSMVDMLEIVPDNNEKLEEK